MQLLPETQSQSREGVREQYPDPPFFYYLIFYHFYPFTKPDYKPTCKRAKNIQSAGINLLGHRMRLARVEIGREQEQRIISKV